jgi:hypothetical protein
MMLNGILQIIIKVREKILWKNIELGNKII